MTKLVWKKKAKPFINKTPKEVHRAWSNWKRPKGKPKSKIKNG